MAPFKTSDLDGQIARQERRAAVGQNAVIASPANGAVPHNWVILLEDQMGKPRWHRSCSLAM